MNATSKYNWHTIKNTDTRPNFNQGYENNPELVTNFESAKLMLFKNNQNSEDELFKLLIPKKERENIDNKIKALNPTQINEKVKKFYDDKKEKIEKIQMTAEEKQIKECTFKPELISEKSSQQIEKRTFEEFIKSQENHLKQTDNNNKLAAEDKEKKLKLTSTYTPNIDSNSIQMVQELRAKNEENEKVAGLRLYKKRNAKQQKILHIDAETNHLESINKVDVLGNKMKTSEYEQKLVSTMKTKKTKKADMENTKYIKEKLYTKGMEDKLKVKEELFNKAMESEVHYIEPIVSQMQLNNSKIYYNKFITKYEECIGGSVHESKYFDKAKVVEILEKLGMILFKSDEVKKVFLASSPKKAENNENVDNVEAKINRDNKFEMELVNKLITELVLNIKEEENIQENPQGEDNNQDQQESVDGETILNNDFFYFISTLCGLRNYHLIKVNSKDTPNLKAEKADTLLQEIESEQEKLIKDKKEFTSRSNDGRLIITNAQANKIKIEFASLYLNMSVNNALASKNIHIQEHNTTIYNFKPEINQYSKEIYTNYLSKLNENENNPTLGERDNSHNDKMAYIERLIMRKKKKDAENEQIKLNLQEKEMNNCTFKPELKATSGFYKSLNKEESIETSKGKRYEHLYQVGTQKRRERKNLEKNEIEYSKFEKDCTFNPDLKKPDQEQGYEHDIYNDKSYMLLYDRLKKGHIERTLKNLIHERGGIPKELAIELNKPKPDVSQLSITKAIAKSPVKKHNQSSTENKNLSVTQGQDTVKGGEKVDDSADNFNAQDKSKYI